MWSATEALLSAAVDEGVVPGCALCVRTAEEELYTLELGQAELRPRRRPVGVDQPWDLASLTKVLATTPLTLAMVAAGELSLEDTVDARLGEGPPGVTLRHLLQHASGLPAWLPLFEELPAAGQAWGSRQTRAACTGRALAAPVEAPPGVAHRYSDLGFLALGAVLEAAGGARIDTLFERYLPLPAEADLRWGWPEAAATEDCPLRQRVVVGEVHDLNAALMGGRAPHAGLFGSARSVAAAAAWQLRAWRGEVPALPRRLMVEAWSTRGPGSHRLGWDGVTQGASTAGPRWPADGVGHTGFTGCTLWVAPRQGIVVTFLSNRVHPEILGGARPDAPVDARLAAYRRLRPALHTAVVEALEAAGRWS